MGKKERAKVLWSTFGGLKILHGVTCWSVFGALGPYLVYGRPPKVGHYHQIVANPTIVRI